MSWATPITGGVRLQLHVQPRASRTEATGRHGDALKVRLAAPPVDGAANEALARWLAAALKVPESSITLVRGTSSRRKVMDVTGISVAQAEQLLGAPR